MGLIQNGNYDVQVRRRARAGPLTESPVHKAQLKRGRCLKGLQGLPCHPAQEDPRRLAVRLVKRSGVGMRTLDPES